MIAPDPKASLGSARRRMYPVPHPRARRGGGGGGIGGLTEGGDAESGSHTGDGQSLRDAGLRQHRQRQGWAQKCHRLQPLQDCRKANSSRPFVRTLPMTAAAAMPIPASAVESVKLAASRA